MLDVYISTALFRGLFLNSPFVQTFVLSKEPPIALVWNPELRINCLCVSLNAASMTIRSQWREAIWTSVPGSANQTNKLHAFVFVYLCTNIHIAKDTFLNMYIPMFKYHL